MKRNFCQPWYSKDWIDIYFFYRKVSDKVLTYEETIKEYAGKNVEKVL